MDEPHVIKPLSVKAAADRLGLTEFRVRGLIDEGKLRPVVRTPALKLDADDVEELRLARRDAAFAEFQARGVDLVKLAVDTRRHLRPGVHDPFAGGVRGLSHLPSNVRALFGPAALVALTLSDREQCCWCAARVAAGLFKVPEPKYGEVLRALLGPPCAADMRRFARSELDRLAVRVHPGGRCPSVGRTSPVAASAPSSAPVARPRPAQPVDDNGKAMVARRLKETRARLAAARRSGDQKYMIRLRAMVQGLEQDAARVDGRSAVTASAERPGTLRCGHALSAGCGCPRRSSARGRR